MLIFTGRFQPFHKGHLGLVHRLLETYPQETICLAVIKDVPLKQATDFDQLVNTQLDSKRNPFNSEITLRLIEEVLRDDGLSNVVVTLMPRASVETWDAITALFDCDRTWVFTQNTITTDDWENKKCAFYQTQGEKVMRLPIKKNIEGTDIREAILRKDYDLLATILPDAVLRYLRKSDLRF